MNKLMEKLKTEWKIERIRKRKYENKTETSKVFAFLLKENRIEDLKRCEVDQPYLDRLIKEMISSKK